MRKIITRLLLQCLGLFPLFVLAEGGPCTFLLGHVVTDEFCPGFYDGGIDLTATGASGSVSYVWSNGEVTEDISGITSGTYTVIATDMAGCIAYDTVTVGASFVLSVELGPDTTVCTFDNIVLNGTTPGATYYYWQDGSGDSMFVANAAGMYTCYAQDDNGCYDEDTIVLIQFPIPLPSIATTHPECGASLGSLDLSVANGTAPFSFLWSNSMTTEDVAALPVGEYTVTVTDSNGCEGITNSIVVAPVSLSSYFTSESIVCSSHTLQFSPLQYGIDFDGSYDYIEVPDAPSIRPDSQWTIEAWVSPSGTTGPVQTILEKRTSAEDGYSIRYNPVDRLVYVRLQNGPLLTTFNTNSNLALYQWNHLALVIDDTDVRFYLNGSLENAVTYTGGVSPTIGTPLTVGGGPNRQSFKGRIDEVIHWNKPLAPSAVDELRIKNLPVGQPGVGLLLNFNQSPGGSMAYDVSSFGQQVQLVYLDTAQCWVQTNPMGMDFVWDFGDGTVTTGQAPYHGYLPRVFQTMTTTLTVSTDQGCQTVDTFMLPVHTPAVPFVNADTAQNYCMGDTVNLWGQFGYATYNWSTGSTNDTIMVLSSGNYALTADDGQGCIHSGSLGINFNPNGTPLPVITPAGTLSICEGDTLVLDVGTGYAYYMWSNGDTSQMTAVTDSGVYQVTVRNGFGCERTSTGVHVITYPGPPASISSVGNVLTASFGISFQWYLFGGLIPGAIGNQFLASANGDYTVLVRGLGGCADLSDPYSFVVGIEDQAEWGNASLFPNPTGGDAQIQLFLAKPATTTVEIMDLTGRRLMQWAQKSEAGLSYIDLPATALAKGSYLVKLSVGSSQWTTNLVRF